MSDEIDEFIRRAAERRKQGQGQKKPARAVQQAPATPPARERLRPALAPEIVDAEVVEDVSAHVSRHLNTREFEQRASHMTDQVDQADDRVEARLHQTFDHQLGRLKTSGTAAGAAPTVRSATDVAAIVTTADSNQMLTFLINGLRTPQNVRQAIIFSEILARPEHRW